MEICVSVKMSRCRVGIPVTPSSNSLLWLVEKPDGSCRVTWSIVNLIRSDNNHSCCTRCSMCPGINQHSLWPLIHTVHPLMEWTFFAMPVGKDNQRKFAFICQGSHRPSLPYHRAMPNLLAQFWRSLVIPYILIPLVCYISNFMLNGCRRQCLQAT